MVPALPVLPDPVTVEASRVWLMRRYEYDQRIQIADPLVSWIRWRCYDCINESNVRLISLPWDPDAPSIFGGQYTWHGVTVYPNFTTRSDMVTGYPVVSISEADIGKNTWNHGWGTLMNPLDSEYWASFDCASPWNDIDKNPIKKTVSTVKATNGDTITTTILEFTFSYIKLVYTVEQGQAFGGMTISVGGMAWPAPQVVTTGVWWSASDRIKYLA